MANILGDSLIRRLRKERDLTTAELSDGICSEEHLTRIERGKRAPSRWVFKQIMERLGENPNKYYTDVVTLEDKRVVSLKDELKGLLLERTAQADKRAEALIEALKQDEAFDTKEGRQFLAMSRATLAYNREDYDDLHKFALEALTETKADFDADKIDEYFLSNDEIWATMQFGVSLFFVESIEKSTEILGKLRPIIERGCVDSDDMIHTYTALLYNLSKNLGLQGKYDEAICVATKGIEWCKKHRESYHQPMIMFNKAYCLLFQGEIDEAKELLEKVYCLFKGNGRDDELSYLSNFVEDRFDVVIPSVDLANNTTKKDTNP